MPIFCVALCVGAVFSFSNNKVEASASTANTVAVGELTFAGYANHDKNKVFDSDKLAELYGKLVGTTTATYADVAALGTKTSADFRTANGGKDVLVTFGGFQWTVTYLTQESGNVVLDLWLAESTDTSMWTDGWFYLGANSWTYPANLYGTSYIRAITLNNGGFYTYATANDGITMKWVNVSSPSDVTSKTATQSASHKFAKFTMSGISGSLTDYLLTPAQVSYQASESFSALCGGAADCSNEGYTSGASIIAGYNYESNPKYDAWKNDKLWLPSFSETGTADGTNGIWKTSANQKRNSVDTWTRTAKHDAAPNGSASHKITAGGGYDAQCNGTYEIFAVRPAMHLNLTKAESAKASAVKVPDLTGTTTVNYTGSAQSVLFNSDYDVTKMQIISAADGTETATIDNPKGEVTATNVGNYTIKVALKANDLYWDDTVANNTSKGANKEREFTFTIKPKQVPKPVTVAALTYNGAAQKFTITNFDSAVMDYGTSSGGTFTVGSLPAGMSKGAGAKDFEATNAGKYEIEFRLKPDASGVVRNYAWDDGTQTILKVPYEIKPKTLEFSFSQPGTSWTVPVTDTGAITQTYAGTDGPVAGETPHLQYYYYFQTDGAAYKVVIAEGDPLNIEDVKDKNGNRTTGVYVTGVQFAKDPSGLDYPVNLNYTLGPSAEIANLTLTAGVAGIDGLTLAYKDSTMGATDPVQALPTGTSALKYTLDGSGNPVAYFPQIDFTGTVFEAVGNPSYVLADGSTPSFASGITRAGKVTVTVNIAIKASEQATNKMPATYSGTKFKKYTYTDNAHATVEFEYEIGKMAIDTSVFKLQYSYDKTNWKDFATSGNKVEFAGATIYVRIDPVSLEPVSAGISVMFGTSVYASGKNKGAYTASANFTLTDNDNFSISSANYNWEITNKQINVTNWVPGDFNIGGVDHIGEIMVINGHNALYAAGVIEYVYTWSAMDGSSGSGVGEAELSKIFAVAGPTNQVTVTATVQLKGSATGTYDLTGSALTSAAFYVGAAKSTATITNAGSAEYGSVNESAFGVSVEADGANLPATNPSTGALLYEVYLHDYDGLSVDNISGNGYGLLSGVDFGKLNAGKYVIEVRFTAAGSQDYAPKGARQLFEITPKKIVVPQVTGEITFNGEYIDIAGYLDENYNADIMSMVSGYTNKNAGAYTVTFKLASSNYMWVEPTSAELASKKLFGKAVLFVDGIGIDNAALTATLNWKINKIVLGTDGWNLGSKEGVSLNALDSYAEMIEASGLDVAIAYRYYDTNGNLIEEPVLKGGDKYIVEAYLTGADAANFEFADGTDEAKSVSAQQEYTVPQSGVAAFFGSAVGFMKTNWLWLVIAAAILLFLIILICIIASAKKKKKRRLAEEKAERERKLAEEKEEKEREREERRLEREERMARTNQQQSMPQMMMPQMLPSMMPQMQMPQQQPQPMSQTVQPVTAGGGSMDGSQFAMIQAELAAIKAEQSAAKELAAMRAEQSAAKELAELKAKQTAKETAEQQVIQAKNEMQFANMANRMGGEQVGGISVDTMTEIMTAALKNVLATATQQAVTAQPAQPAQLTDGTNANAAPAATQVPPDAVMTTVTTTKIDTTKKAQSAQGNAQQTRQTRSFVPPMPVDDGRVFDVGGFYKPADPVDLVDDEDNK